MSDNDILSEEDKARICRQIWADTPTWAKVIVIGGPLYMLTLALIGLGWAIFVRGSLLP